MQLKVNTQSQRNPQWGSLLLGYNTQSVYTIYSYGCLITTLGNYVGKQPDEVNQLLKDNGGFTQGSGNLIWSKTIVLGLTQTYLSPYYTDAVTTQGITKIKELINEGYPLVCEVDFNPADTIKQQHFVLLAGVDEAGNVLVVDPWEGQWETWSEAACKRNIYQFRAYDKKLDKDLGTDPLRECMNARDSHWNDLDTIKNDLVIVGEYNLELIRKRIEMLQTIEREYGTKDQQVQDAQKEISELKMQVGIYQDQNAKLALEASTLTEKATELEKKYEQSTQNYEDALKKIHILEGTITKPSTGWQKIIDGIIELLPKWR